MISPEYLALLDKMKDLHQRKNAGYSGDDPDPWLNFRQCEDFGISAEQGVITRMSDKWSRFRSLWRKPEHDQVGEAIEDTLMDLAAYSLVLICLLEERKQQPKTDLVSSVVGSFAVAMLQRHIDQGGTISFASEEPEQ